MYETYHRKNIYKIVSKKTHLKKERRIFFVYLYINKDIITHRKRGKYKSYSWKIKQKWVNEASWLDIERKLSTNYWYVPKNVIFVLSYILLCEIYYKYFKLFLTDSGLLFLKFLWDFKNI